MTIQHSAIPDAQRHEPKGIDAAGAGTAYVCNGSATGSWVKVQKAQAACLKASSAGATTGITTAFQEINNATLGGTVTWSQNTNIDLTTDTTSGYIQVLETGTYHINYTASFIPATNGSVFEFTFGVDSGAGIVSKESVVRSIITTSGTTDSKQISFACLPSLTANDKVYIMVKETSAGEELTLSASNFVVIRVA